ncbi:MAG: YajQ family cyclic di-GMP-binding protein [Bacteroidetes bacterium]|nr:YajQ family cyclic di-GMP-binding protein [Bacteroidota bacterium]
MAKSSSSFDVVSEVDLQEVDNAINQALKEIHQRYDLKASDTEITLNKKDQLITINTKDDYAYKQSLEIIRSKFVKRNVPLKALNPKEPEPAASGRIKIIINLNSGISKENAKKITKMIKDMNLKVSAQILDEKLRVQGAKKDELQAVMQAIREADFDFPTQFINFQ